MKSIIIGLSFLGFIALFGSAKPSTENGGFLSSDGQLVPGASTKYWAVVLNRVGDDMGGLGGDLIDTFIGLFSQLDVAVSQNDVNQARNLMERGSNLWGEILPYMKSDGVRQAILKTNKVDKELLRKFSTGTVTIEDINEFFIFSANIFNEEFGL